MGPKTRFANDKLLLAAVLLVLSASTVLWTLRDKTPPSWDPSDHLTTAYDYYQPLAQGNFGGFWQEFIHQHHYYAPLVHLVTASFFLVFGASRLSGIAVNLVSLAMLLWSVYWIGQRVYSTAAGVEPDAAATPASGARWMPSPAVLAAILAATYHFTAWLLHDAFLDYPLTAIVTASFALLIRAGDFGRFRDALLFGVAAGLGLLTKQTFGFFFVFPAIYLIVKVILSRRAAPILNLAAAGLIAAAIAALWYGPHIRDVLEIYRINQIGAIEENEAPLFSLMSNVFYFHALLSAQMQALFGIVFLTGLGFSIARYRRVSVLLYLWLASGLIGFALIANKDLRYTVPVLPAAALISVACLAAPPRKQTAGSAGPRAVFARYAGHARSLRSQVHAFPDVLRAAAAAAVVILAAISFYDAQWPRDGQGFCIDTPRFRWMVLARNYFGLDHRPLSNDWAVPETVQMVATQPAAASPAPPPTPTEPPHDQARTDAKAKPRLGVIVNIPFLNPSGIALYSRLMAPGRAAPPLIDVDWLTMEPARPRIDACDYILVRTGLKDADWSSAMEKQAEKLIASEPDRFVRLASFPIPMKNAEAVIYKRTRPESPGR